MSNLDRDNFDRGLGELDAEGAGLRPEPASLEEFARGSAAARSPRAARLRTGATPASGANGERPERAQASRGSGGEAPDTLANYFRSIGTLPILTREQTYELARRMEAEQATFRSAMFAVPATARKIVALWESRRRTGHTTAALSVGYRDGTGRDWSRAIDLRMRRIARLVEERGRVESQRSARSLRRLAELDKEIAERLGRAGLAPEVVHDVYRRFRPLTETGLSRADQKRRRSLGLGLPAARAQLARARAALERLEEAKRTFVTHNLKLVVKNAKRYRNMGVPYVDLIQEGNLGLIRAVEKFDYRRGFKFSTYAVWWIEQALIRAVQNQSRTVRVPSHIYEIQIRQRSIQRELRQRLGRAPTRDELAEALDVAPEVIERTLTSMKPITSTQAALPGTDEFTLEDALTDPEASDPIEEIDSSEVRRQMVEQLSVLGPRERSILEWRFGLGAEEPYTLQEIGARLGLSRERVRQLEARALSRLRERREVRQLAASLDLPDEQLGRSAAGEAEIERRCDDSEPAAPESSSPIF